jgi:hypothetical protein
VSDQTSLPFARYRHSGREPLGRPAWGDGSCRRGYGLPVFAACGTACAYCDRQLGESYESWLDLSIDHVVPGETVKRLGWPREWIEDIINLVTCCRACNEFLNGYRVSDPPPVSCENFIVLRDQHFSAKRAWVIDRHVRERAWYDAWIVGQGAESRVNRSSLRAEGSA